MTNLEKINKAIELGKELASKSNNTKDYKRIIDELNELSGDRFNELDDDLNSVFHDSLNLEKTLLIEGTSFISPITTILERRISNKIEKHTIRVRIKHIQPPTAIVISPDGKKYELNEYEFHDLRVQIKNIKEKGWKVKPTANDTETEIDTDGRVANWFDGRLFGNISDYLLELI